MRLLLHLNRSLMFFSIKTSMLIVDLQRKKKKKEEIQRDKERERERKGKRKTETKRGERRGNETRG